MSNQEQDNCLHIERLRHSNRFVPLEPVILLQQWLEQKRDSRQCGYVVGDSRAGKTKACKAYIGLFGGSHITEEEKILPICYMRVAPKSSSCEFYRALSECYGPGYIKGTVSSLRAQVLETISTSKTGILIIDQADWLSLNVLYEAINLANELEISVVLIGDQRLNYTIYRDEKLLSRFGSCHVLEGIHSDDLKGVVRIWEEEIIALPTPSNLVNRPLLELIGKATSRREGRHIIGLLDAILREAAIASLRKDLQNIDHNILYSVAKSYCC